MAAPHSVQFFDTHDSAARALGHFVGAGLAKGEHIILVTRLDDFAVGTPTNTTAPATSSPAT
jgi:hypothetical protein